MPRTRSDDTITDNELKLWGKQWRRGRSKNDIERTEMNDPYSHGKRITRLWRERLNVETEEDHPMRREIQRLRDLLERSGIDPDEEP